MSTPAKYELLKRTVLTMFPESTRREVMFFGPERRQGSMKIAVSNVGNINIDKVQKTLKGCEVFMRNNPMGGARLDIYVPCKVAPLAVRRFCVALTVISWAAVVYMCTIIKGRATP